MSTKCSVAILTLNNEDTIRQCLESVSFCDDIVVLDGNSTDKTLEIAKEFGARIFPQHEGKGKNIEIENFTQMRIKSFNLCKNDWVFFVDSDEYLDETLQKEVAQIVKGNDKMKTGRFERIAVVDGKAIDKAYFYPEMVDRLVNRTSGTHWKAGSRVHESLVFPEGITKTRLKGKLMSHWPDLARCKKKDAHYLRLAREKFIAGVDKTTWTSFLRGWWKNTLRAFRVLALAAYLPLRYANQNVLPFRYHMRFFWYNLNHAWHPAKWKALMHASWKRLPKMLKTIIVAGLILRLLLFAVLMVAQGQDIFVYGPNGDAVEYVTLAENMIQHGEFSLSPVAPFHPNDFRTPGYPVFLMLTGGGYGLYWPAVLVQIIASMGLVLMVYFFTRKHFNQNIALIAAALTSFEPNMVYWPNQLITEALFTVLLFACFYIFITYLETKKLSQLVWYGIILAVATYIRQVSYALIFLIPMFGAAAILVKEKSKAVLPAFKTAIFALIIPMLMLTPWMYRNAAEIDSFSYGSSFAVRGSIGKYLEAYTLQKFGAIPDDVYPQLAEVNGDAAAQVITSLAFSTVAEDPVTYMRIGLSTLVPFFASDGWFTIAKTVNPAFEVGSFNKTWSGGVGEFKALLDGYLHSGGMPFLAAKALYALLALCTILGTLMSLVHRNARTTVLFLILMTAFFAVGSGLGSYARFRYPIEPVLFIFAAVFIAWLMSKRTKRA